MSLVESRPAELQGTKRPYCILAVNSKTPETKPQRGIQLNHWNRMNQSSWQDTKPPFVLHSSERQPRQAL